MLDVTDNLGAGSGPGNGNSREMRDGFEAEVGHPFVGYQVLETDIEVDTLLSRPGLTQLMGLRPKLDVPSL